jgi:hypothetical protein
VRKVPLVVHVEEFGLALVGKTCQLCLRCGTPVAHKADLDSVLRTIVDIPSPKYVVLGTIDTRVYRRGLLGGASLDDVKEHMADFKSHWKVDVIPGG